jgi:hypothetical protein
LPALPELNEVINKDINAKETYFLEMEWFDVANISCRASYCHKIISNDKPYFNDLL